MYNDQHVGAPTCTARGCSNPTQTSLCRDSLGQLVDALRELAAGSVTRSTALDLNDKRVVVPTDAEGNSVSALAYLPADLEHRQGLLDDLQDTVTRTDNLAPQLGEKVRTADATSIEFHVAASHLADEARRTIGRWAREVWEHNPHLHLPATHAEACAWLAGLPTVLAAHANAGAMHDQITLLADRIRRMVDRRPELTPLGPCGGLLPEDQACDWELAAAPYESVVQCRRCRRTHVVADRRRAMLARMEDQLLTATEMRTALTRYMPQGVPPVGTIHRWASEGRIGKRSPLPGGKRPRYRVGDVLDLIARQQQDSHDKEASASWPTS